MTVVEDSTSNYIQLCELAETVPFNRQLSLSSFTNKEDMAARDLNERLTASLQIFINMIAGNESAVEQVDKILLDHYIAKLDQAIGAQLDEILHHKQFQKYESTWRSLKYLNRQRKFSRQY